MWDILLIVLVTGGSLGILFWWQSNHWGPRKKWAMLNQQPLSALEAWNFKVTESAFAEELTGSAAAMPVAYVGYLEGYAVEVSFGWEERPHFVVRVFFDPDSRDYEGIMHSWQDGKAVAQKWAVGECIYYAPVYADTQLSYSFRPPKAEQLIAVAQQMIELLQSIARKPIAYSVGCELATYVLDSSKRKSLAGKI